MYTYTNIHDIFIYMCCLSNFLSILIRFKYQATIASAASPACFNTTFNNSLQYAAPKKSPELYSSSSVSSVKLIVTPAKEVERKTKRERENEREVDRSGWSSGSEGHSETDRKIERQTDRQTDRKTDIQTDRQIVTERAREREREVVCARVRG